jgi:hypothetical protein
MCLGCPKPGEWMVIYSICIYCIWSFTLLAWDSQDTYTVYDHSLSWLRTAKTHILYMTIHSPGLGQPRHIYCIWSFTLLAWDSQDTYTVYDHSLSWLGTAKTHILYMTIHSPGLGQPRHIYCIRRVNGHIQYMCLGCPKPGEWMVIYSICVLAVLSQESEWSYTVYVSWLSQARRVNDHMQYMCLGCPKPGEWMVIYSICVLDVPSQESEWSYTVYVSWLS